MTERVRANMLRWVRKAQDYLQERTDFFQDVEARGLFVALMTVQCAIEFDDMIELGEHCSEFCNRKQRETEINGEPGQSSAGDDDPERTP